MNLNDISKYLSFILRHKPEEIGLTLDAEGWANIEELIQKSTPIKTTILTPEILFKYVHLSTDQNTAETVGKRYGKPHILKIQSQKMVEDGFKFYQAENGVWLISHVPTQYLVS